MFHIVLVRPEKVNNVGSICRLMENFGAKSLSIVQSTLDATDLELKKTARWGWHRFLEARHVDSLQEALEPMSYSIATTARIAGERIIERLSFTPEEIPWSLLGNDPAIVFGPESDGLKTVEIEQCNFTVSIPTKKEYRSLNLSHAVAIILYTGYRYLHTKPDLQTDNWVEHEPASPELLEKLFNFFEGYNKQFVEVYKQQLTTNVFRNIINRAKVTKREASRMVGLFEAWQIPWSIMVDKLEELQKNKEEK